MRFMLNWLFTSIAIAIATFLVPGIQPFGFAEAWVCFAFVGLFLNIVDSLVKPFLTVISLPLTIITLGVFQLVVNSFMLELASYPVGQSAGRGHLHRQLWIGLYGQYPGIHHAQHPRQHRRGLKRPFRPCPSQQPKTKAAHRKNGRPSYLSSLKGRENLPFLPRPQMAGVG